MWLICLGHIVLEGSCGDAVCLSTVFLDVSVYSVGRIPIPTLPDNGHVKRLLHGAWSGIMLIHLHEVGRWL